MRIVAATLALLATIFCAHAQFSGNSLGGTSATDGGFSGNPPPVSAGCSQATTFLARTSGLSGTETSAYTGLICGLVTDGIITGTLSGGQGCGTLLDGLYFFATNTTTTAHLNICGTVGTITEFNSPTFSADHGYTGVDTNTTPPALDTGMDPGSGGTTGMVMSVSGTSPSANFSAWNNTNSADTTGGVITGRVTCGGFGCQILVQPNTSGSVNVRIIQDTTDGFSTQPSLPADVRGMWSGNRDTQTTNQLYFNGVAQTQSNVPSTNFGAGNGTIMFLATSQNGGGATSILGSGKQVMGGSFGASLTGTQMSNLCKRFNTALQLVAGITNYAGC